MLGTGSGFGKVILFGEHFVVYDIPSIVSAIGDYTIAEVFPDTRKDDADFFITDDRPETPGYKNKKREQQEASIRLMLEFVQVELEKKTLFITFGGPLLAASGVGASAASCVAFARALNNEYKLGLSDKEINDMAYEGEKGYHGSRPSGVDNTAATYGGLIQFIKGKKPVFDHIKIPKPVEIVMGNTGLTADTTAVVNKVRQQKEKNIEKYETIFRQASELIPKARLALETGDHNTVGKLMQENHRLLQQINVSCPELDLLVNIALKNGAAGAKMTGTGRGGYMIALTPGPEIQNKVARAIKAQGFKVLMTTIGV